MTKKFPSKKQQIRARAFKMVQYKHGQGKKLTKKEEKIRMSFRYETEKERRERGMKSDHSMDHLFK